MKNYTTEDLRNIAVIGHGDAGKTSLVSAMLYTAGAESTRAFAQLMALVLSPPAMRAASPQEDNQKEESPPTPPADSRDRAPGLRVVGNIYFDLPGLDMTTLTPLQKQRFLQRVNREYCLCGRSNCVRDPVANCYMNDPGCGHAKKQARQIRDEVKGGK